MKTKLCTVLLLVLLFSCCITHKNRYHSQIYHQIYNCQGIDIQSLNRKIRPAHYVGIHSYYVNKLIQWDYLSKLAYSKKNDTVYILELDGIQGNFLFTAWNKNDTLNYISGSGGLVQTEDRLFIKHMMNLVSEWNIDEIRKEEKINKAYLPEEIIYATRIMFNKGKYNIECISFYEFFNLKRDGMDWR